MTIPEERAVNDRLAEMMAAYTPALRVALRRQGVAAADVDDVLSHVWERAWRHLATLSPFPYHWLLTVARYAAVDHHRATRCRIPTYVDLSSVAGSSEPADPPEAIEPGPGPAELVEGAWCVADLLGHLPADDRAAMIDIALAGRTLAETGARAGRSKTWAFLSRERGRRMLAAALVATGEAA
jgi:DNA-directed RNA polymerase specialized sigma24 family protein